MKRERQLHFENVYIYIYEAWNTSCVFRFFVYVFRNILDYA